MNKEQYNKTIKNKLCKSVCREEQKFYKKRIVNLTKDLLSKPSIHEKTIFPDVKLAFNNYIKICVEYFKSLDNNDILQEEYKNIEEKIVENLIENNEIIIKENSENNINKLLMRSIEIKPLDKFVKRTITKKQEEMIMPKQKDIDLKNPSLKNKGII
jgi:hypothetical protein